MYAEDLAWIHHAGFSEFAESASSGILEILWRHDVREGLVVDIGCGSGILARELTHARYAVVGFDASPAMIELAYKTVPPARFQVARFANAALPPCDAIVAVGEVLNYGTFDEVRTFFANAADSLRTGGVLLFDIAERESYPPYDETRTGGDDYSVIAIKETKGVRLTRRVLIFREVDGKIRKSEEVHQLELYDRDAVLAALRADFRVKVRRSYLWRRLPKGHMVYECVRR